MTRWVGQFERQLVTALLLVALLISCGIAGSARPTPAVEPTAVAEDPTATAAPPVAQESPLPTTTALPAATAPPRASATARTSASAAIPATPPTPTTVPPTPTRKPSTSPLAKNRLVTYYGHPASAQMGILGEYDNPDAMVAKLKEQAAAYTAADPGRPGLCTIELIASVAQNVPGNDNLWLIRTPKTVIERYAQLAERSGCLLMLDIQMGYDTVANEIESLLPFLQRPYVHLAIDPEFKVDPGEKPGDNYGSVSAADVNYASQVLGDLVRKFNLPDKVLIVHQFRDDMLPDKAQITPLPNVDLVLVMDGWGTIDSKRNNYQYFVKEQLLQYGGIKLFYRQDTPLMTPQQVIELDPTPLIVIYQ